MNTNIRTSLQPLGFTSPLFLALLVNFIWINASEVFRYEVVKWSHLSGQVCSVSKVYRV